MHMLPYLAVACRPIQLPMAFSILSHMMTDKSVILFGTKLTIGHNCPTHPVKRERMNITIIFSLTVILNR